MDGSGPAIARSIKTCDDEPFVVAETDARVLDDLQMVAFAKAQEASMRF
jgi:hypothetical protein